VYVVDDDPSVRRALSRLLRVAGHEVSAFRQAEEFLDSVGSDDPAGCLIVDLRMPGLDGLALQQQLRGRGIGMPVVFISGVADVKSSIQALKGGALDFLEKPVSEEALLSAVKRALEDDFARRLERRERAALLARLETLTPREREVFGLVATGLLNKQVGAQLGTTEKTVKVHRSRVMQKMGAASLAELVRMCDKLQTRPAPAFH
jgi:FixJ family two-component response regulator